MINLNSIGRRSTLRVDRSVLALLTIACIWAVVQRPPSVLPAAPAPAASAAAPMSSLPLSFIPGDWAGGDRARYHVRDRSGYIAFGRHDVALTLDARADADTPVAVRMVFDGAGTTAVVGLERQVGVANYLLGNDSALWRTALPTFGAVQYQALYRGIDLRYDGTSSQLKGTYDVAAGADPSQIRWHHEGASAVSVDEATGDLVVAVAGATGRSVVERAPVAWQTVSGTRRPVDVRYHVAADGLVGFAVGTYDPALPLTIDPVIAYSTFVGSTSPDIVESVALDGDGNTYVTGTRGRPFDETIPGSGQDVFVYKINAAGTAYLYQTVLGGADDDEGIAIAVDSTGRAYVSGATFSPDFPATGGFQQTCAEFAGFDECSGDGFAVRLSAAGAVSYGTYIGSTLADDAEGIAGDDAGHAYVAGQTQSFASPAGDVYVLKIDTNVTGAGSRLYERHIGGTGFEVAGGIAIDAAGNAYVTGTTSSSGLATAGAYQSSLAGASDAFATKLDPAGAIVYTTYLGGGSTESGYGIAVDAAGAVAIAGETRSTNFPVKDASQGSNAGGNDAFVTKLSLDGAAVDFSTYIGGSLEERAYALVLNGAGCAWVVGQTFSSNFPLESALDSTFGGVNDAFVTQVCPGVGTPFSSYLGGDLDDLATDVAMDASGNLLVVGQTASDPAHGFAATSGAVQPNFGGGVSDGFLVKIATGDAGSGTGTGGGTGGGSSGGAGGDNSGTLPDTDLDGLPDVWETLVGLDPNDATGVNGASGDPDGDSRTNLQEFQDGTHPNGQPGCIRFLAEGVVNGFFETRLSLFNPDSQTARVVLRFLKSDGTVKVHIVAIGPLGRVTIDARAVLGGDATFSVVAESDCNDLVLDRLVQWSGHAGSHAESGVAAAAQTWYLAEGATHGGLHTFYLLQNPNAVTAHVHVKFLLPGGNTFEKDFVVGPNSRSNIWLNEDVKEIGATDVSAVITADVNIIAERAMYLGTQGAFFKAGHESAGVTGLQPKWYFAEGATGSFFDTFLLLANPNTQDATVTVRFLLPDGSTVTKVYLVTGNSRRTVWVDYEDALLADTALGIEVEANVGIVCERSMWWGNGGWTEAHNAFGAAGTTSKWGLAEGEIGGAANAETYILGANTAPVDATIKVTVVLDNGQSKEATFVVPGTSRFNIDVRAMFGLAAASTKFSATVERIGGGSASQDLVVERAMYFGNFTSGSDALATALAALHP